MEAFFRLFSKFISAVHDKTGRRRIPWKLFTRNSSN